MAGGTATNGTTAPPQAGIFEGIKPNAWSTSQPITLFIIQSVIIIVFCRALHYPLSYIKQPRVIAEVIGGIMLGPSVLMRIPGFREEVFPKDSIVVLNNVANLGLLLFLFLIGLEVDLRMFVNNWRVAASVGAASMVLPFALGYAIAAGLYEQFHDKSKSNISFTVYGLFIGTALAITAFPVLCRILTELDMLSTPVGVTVLAAGVGNDVVGWVLLALCVALVNNGSGIAALWVLLVAVAWTLFLVFAVRPAFHWLLRKKGAIQNGPSESMIMVTLVLVLISAWFTNIIGVHAIFGAFLVGLICPHEGGFSIKVTERMEDLISALFLPLYFALSGLNTDLGLLNDGKIIGGTLAARAMNLVWRESFAIGCLMSCKGLVELIVLNIGYQANILDQRTFTMFVIMALKLDAWKRGEIDWDGKPIVHDDNSFSDSAQKLHKTKIQRVLVYLRLDSLPSTFTFLSILGVEEVPAAPAEDAAHASDGARTVGPRARPLEVHALRILELTDRSSSVMKVTETEDYAKRDPVINAFRTFSRLHDLAFSGNVVVTPESMYADTVVTSASSQESDFVLVPWSQVGSNTEDQSVPFRVSSEDRYNPGPHLDFVQSVFAKAICTTGILVSNDTNGTGTFERPGLTRSKSVVSMRSNREVAVLPNFEKSHRIFLPFVGGPDDRAALRFVLQIAKNPNVTATILHLTLSDAVDDSISPVPATTSEHVSKEPTVVDSLAEDATLFSTLQSSLPAELAARVTFSKLSVPSKAAAEKAIKAASETIGQNPRNSGNIVVVGRRHSILQQQRRPSSSPAAANYFVQDGMRNTIGVLGQQLVFGGLQASILVIQAGENAAQ
ncbi:Sodium/hydrogen exchanger family-domain-containing protein [Microdochium trichocladiopsis]|uniref:Sodium/hydrogen exchanger family-domain-containing protein n=1 Tax=Microdochium trichocladiopsis TaxID=1682393 RepID=A0A9P8XRN3_9PEZI|nr:Sodium/hydrogen exchanger family-domain-containing protein [Microdochium trichocladiopsis]KAH7009453.1 Sodium/hydrogen exchanger family-domain-containing protein [Microdochium trichocladiopsis]